MKKRIGYRMMAFLSKHMMACDEAGYLISYKQDNTLGMKDKMRLRMHILSCHLCRKYEKQIIQLAGLMDSFRKDCAEGAHIHTLAEESKARIEQVVMNEIGN